MPAGRSLHQGLVLTRGLRAQRIWAGLGASSASEDVPLSGLRWARWALHAPTLLFYGLAGAVAVSVAAIGAGVAGCVA